MKSLTPNLFCYKMDIGQVTPFKARKRLVTRGNPGEGGGGLGEGTSRIEEDKRKADVIF